MKELRVYKHQELVNDLNNVLIQYKKFWIEQDVNNKESFLRGIHFNNVDEMQSKINRVLMQDSEPMVKR